MKLFERSTVRLKVGINICFLLISFYGVVKKDLSYDEVSPFQRLAMGLIGPAQEKIQNGLSFLGNFFTHYIFIVNVSIENQTLKRELAILQDEVFRLREIERENQRLKELLRFGSVSEPDKILAQVVGWDVRSANKVIRINKGIKDGIELKSPVITLGGLVGYVYRAADHYADVITLLDQNNKVDSIVARTRSHGIVQGLSEGRCYMKYVNRMEPVQVGDEVITAGLGMIYPKGIKVGRVSNIEKESYGITQWIEITPSVNFNKLEEVVVLVNRVPITYKDLM